MKFKKYSLLILIWFGFNLLSFGQININSKQGNPYWFRPNDVWNVLITSTVELNVKVQAYISKADGNQIYFSESQPFFLKVGANSHTSGTIQTATSQSFDQGLRNWLQINNSLPPGTYRLCYKIICANSDCDGNGSGLIGPDQSFCNTIKIQSPTPLLLNTPNNESRIKDQSPMLTWIPPSPVSSEVSYDLTLTPILDGQSKEEAIQINRPVIIKTGIKNVLLNYPSDLPDLEIGKKYAWQVNAVLFNEIISTSKVWEFEIIADSLKEEKIISQYIKVKTVKNEELIKVENFLKLDYLEENERRSFLKVEIYNEKNKKIVEYDLPVEFGENLLVLDLKNKGLKSGKDYLVKVSNRGKFSKSFKINFNFKYE